MSPTPTVPIMLLSRIFGQDNEIDLEDSPRPTKRRSSEATLEYTPLPLSLRDIASLSAPDLPSKKVSGCSGSRRPLRLPKTPMAPRPKDAFNWASPPTPSHGNSKLFLPSFDMLMDMPTSLSLGETPVPALPTVAASRLQPRASVTPLAIFRAAHAPLARRHSTPFNEPASEAKEASEQQRRSEQDTSMPTPSTPKAWPEGKPVPAPTLHKSKSWHALCA